MTHCLAKKQKRDATQQRGRVLLDAHPYDGSLLRIRSEKFFFENKKKIFETLFSYLTCSFNTKKAFDSLDSSPTCFFNVFDHLEVYRGLETNALL